MAPIGKRRIPCGVAPLIPYLFAEEADGWRVGQGWELGEGKSCISIGGYIGDIVREKFRDQLALCPFNAYYRPAPPPQNPFCFPPG
jgi:hypothetical protein